MELLVGARNTCARFVRPPTCTIIQRRYAVITPTTSVMKKRPEPVVEEPTRFKTHPSHFATLSTKLRFPVKHTSVDLAKEAYTQPLGGTEKIPFHFSRTLSNKLPIYTDFKVQGDKKEFTIIRKFTGNIEELKHEVSLLIPEAEIEEKASSLVIKGQHSNLIRLWLLGLGF